MKIKKIYIEVTYESIIIELFKRSDPLLKQTINWYYYFQKWGTLILSPNGNLEYSKFCPEPAVNAVYFLLASKD